MITDPAASAPPPPGNPAPLTILPPSGRISARTRRRTASAAGTAPPAVDYGFGPGGAPKPSTRRVTSPWRAPRRRPPVLVVMAPAPAASSVSTVPIPSDRDRAEPVGTPLSRLRLPTDAPPVTTTDLDAVGAAAEFQFGDSAARNSHADWAREPQAEPAYHADTRYIALGPPAVLPADFLSCFPSHQRPHFSEVQELANKNRLHTTDAGNFLLV